MACACRFTSDQKEGLTGVSGVTITTYTMIAFSGKRSEESARVMDQIRSREWGLLLMDEVHVVPAQMFRKVCLRCCTVAPASALSWRGCVLPDPACYSIPTKACQALVVGILDCLQHSNNNVPARTVVAVVVR